MSTRVPPATSLVFADLANQVCDRAKVDEEDRRGIAYELQTHLEGSWRDFIESGLTTGQAEERAISRFGNLDSIARSYREPFPRRLLVQRNTQTARLLIILVCFALADSIRPEIEHSLNNIHPDWLVAIPDGLGVFIGTLAVLYFFARFRPKFLNRYRAFSFLKWTPLAWFVWKGEFSALAVLVYPVIGIPFLLQTHHWTRADLNADMITVVSILLILIPLGFLALTAALAEVFDWPRFKRQRNKLVTWLLYRSHVPP
jgi:hypothetical protein